MTGTGCVATCRFAQARGEKKNASQCTAPPRTTVSPPAVPTAPSSSATSAVANASTAVANATSDVPKVVPIHTNDVHGDAAAHSAAAMPSEGSSSSHAVSSGTVVAVIMILVLVVAVGVWLLYAYRNPQTPAGQLLIKVLIVVGLIASVIQWQPVARPERTRLLS
ncbi:hypothetical protein HPB52_019731 [Rhipicephalus sanguineus]|uniref:Uncharacterized protein n=1 Tax=Rhipicephalus sanguineus TaxID=34632 RepID=A0A9D4Q2A5_RHISA|nr:hypothetical protein HPB52_019731 [Rhipicephalus sanguineus]